MKARPAERKANAATDGSRRPITRFFALFALLLLAYYLFGLWRVGERLFASWLEFNAWTSHGLLLALGQDTQRHYLTISSSRFAVDIARGCDASDPMAFYAAAMLAFPLPWRRKLLGLAVGWASLYALNEIRIVSLFLIGGRWPGLFNLAHNEFWQIAFIVFAVVLWSWWILRELRPAPAAPPPKPQAAPA